MSLSFDPNQNHYYFNNNKTLPLVFIHGVGLDHNMWGPQINEFDNTVLIYDILGHGRTPLNKEKISFDDFSDQIIDLIDELKFDKIHLVGFSIGSLIARNFGTKFSDRLKSLTLLCSIFNRSNDEQKIVNERFEQTKKDQKLTKDALKRWFNKDFIEKNPLISDKIITILNNNNMDNFIKVYSLFVNHKDNEKFENINVKTLVMTGEGDIGSTPEMTNNLSKKIKNSESKIIPVGKHLCSIECSYDVNKAIKDHIKNA